MDAFVSALNNFSERKIYDANFFLKTRLKEGDA